MKSYPSLTGCSNGWSSILISLWPWHSDVKHPRFLALCIRRTPVLSVEIRVKKCLIHAKIRYLKISARPDLASDLLQILISATNYQCSWNSKNSFGPVKKTLTGPTVLAQKHFFQKFTCRGKRAHTYVSTWTFVIWFRVSHCTLFYCR